MYMIFIIIKFKFNIDINTDELFIITCEHNKKENCHWQCVAMLSPSSISSTKDIKIIFENTI